MARTKLTKISMSGPYSGSLTSITWTAADASNKNEFHLSGDQIILIRNDSGSAHNVTLSSSRDPYGRTEDITVSVPASAFRAFPATVITGWIQSDSNFYLEADDAQIEFAILTLP